LTLILKKYFVLCLLEGGTPTEMISDAKNFFLIQEQFLSCNWNIFLTARKKFLCQEKILVPKIVTILKKNLGIRKHF